MLVVNDIEVSQTDHHPNPENSAGNAQTHHPARYTRLCNLISLLLTMLLSTLRLPTTLTEVSGQNPAPGIPVPPSDPVPLSGYSSNTSELGNCPSLGTPGTHLFNWVRTNFLRKRQKRRPDCPKVPRRPVRFLEWMAVSRPSRQRMRRTCASGGGRKGALPARFPLSVAAHTWSRIVRPRACGAPRRGRAGPARPPARGQREGARRHRARLTPR